MRAITTFLFLLSVLATAAGQDAAKTLTAHHWVLDGDEMSGIGKHVNLPENTQLQFAEDGKWAASPGLFGALEGTWTTEKNGTVSMIFGPKKRAVVTEITADRLKIRFRRPGAKRVLAWRPE